MGFLLDSTNFSGIDNHITNCITQISQIVKVELNDGVVTLKAGSNLYIPNGFEEDGTTRKFGEIVTQNDISYDYMSESDSDWLGTRMAFTMNNGTSINAPLINGIKSGTTLPTNSYFGYFYHFTENRIYKHDTNTGENILTSDVSLPFCIYSGKGSVIQSIDRVFNGFGYFGEMIFALPGVKCLIPDGRNSDNTLKNKFYTLDRVIVYSGITRRNDILLLSYDNKIYGWDKFSLFVDEYPEPANKNWYIVYDSVKNLWYKSNNGEPYHVEYFIKVGEYKKTDSEFLEFNIKKPFELLDNDTEYIAKQSFPSKRHIDIPLLASGSFYIAPANGWYCLLKATVNNEEFIWFYNTTTGLEQTQSRYTGNGYVMREYMQVSKGDVISLSYTASGDTISFIFIYANGAS